MSARVVVVGGGVVGVSCAWALARRGAQVTLLERDRVAGAASFGNAGTVSAGHPPLNRPGRVAQALKQMADPTGPLHVAPRWDPALWRWLEEFALNCTDARVRECMDVMAPLGLESLALFDDVVAAEGIRCGYRREGYLDVCRTAKGFAVARHEAGLVTGFGYHPEILDGDAVRAAEPALGPAVLGGVFYPEAATLDPHRFTVGLAEASRRMGVEVREGAEAVEVVMRGGSPEGVRLLSGERVGADAVVLCTGPFSLGMAERLGTRLAVQPGKGYHRDLPVGPGGSPPLRTAFVLNEAAVFCTPMEGFVRYAGTMEFSGLNQTLRRPRLEQLTRSAEAYLPSLQAREPLSEWCGLRPVSADGLPLVGPLAGVRGVVAATGHGMLGLTLGPVTGRVVADWILEGSTDPVSARLSPTRPRG